jgi:uncharacterized protein (DUF885 family)
MRALLFLLLLSVTFPALAQQTASQRLERLAAEAQARAFDLYPFGETMGKGAGPHQDKVELTFSDPHRERQRVYNRWILQELAGIPASELDTSEKLTHALLARRARDSLEWLSYPFHQHDMLIQMDGGLGTTLFKLIARQPLRNEADYRAWLTRAAGLARYIDGVADVLRAGAEAGITTPRVIVESSLKQLDALAPQDIEQSALWKPVASFPASIPEARRQEIAAEYREILTTSVMPALRRLTSYVRSDYLPHARTTDGFSALPEGHAMYRIAVRYETSTDMTPDEIHALGLKEVARVQSLLVDAGRRAGFTGPVSELQSWIASNPRNYPFTSGEQVLDYLRSINARIVPQLPQLFTRFPKARFEIQLTEPELAPTAAAQYSSPSDDGTRPGIFKIPVVDPRKQSVFGLAALLAHEGMPGHHFDVGIRLENPVPEFRRRMWVNAFGEGWALYAESLGERLGIYDDPLELMGRYHFELFRACRLVIDTGLHLKGWTRVRAIDYFMNECGQSRGGATVEVLRYMVWPGQALGYKIGELTIRDIRNKAEQRLGSRFDIRAFHDAVLAEGALPLAILRARMDEWIDERARKSDGAR